MNENQKSKQLEQQKAARQQKRKTTRNFFLLTLAGGGIGALLALASILLTANEGLESSIAAIGLALQASSAHLSILIAVLTLLASLLLLLQASRLTKTWDGEDDAFYQRIEHSISLSIGISSIAIILQITWFGLVMTAVQQNQLKLGLFFAAALALLFSAILHSFLQRRAVDLTKALNPEKRGDALELNFQKKWLKSCDEQERLCAYRAAYKAFSILPVLMSILFILLVLASWCFSIGFLPFFVLGIVWISLTAVYLREVTRNSFGMD